MRKEYKQLLAGYRFHGQSSQSRADVPEHLHEGIAAYIADGVPPGGFLCAVVCNDLRGAFERADSESSVALHAIVAFMYNHAPSACWGSQQRMVEWIQRGGANGTARPFKNQIG